MTNTRTESLTLKKDDGTLLYVWLAKDGKTIKLQSSKDKEDSNPFGDVILFPSNHATVFPSGSFKTWEIHQP